METKQVKFTMSAVRLTGEQSRRLMQLAREGADEANSWCDGTLERYGLAETIDMPAKTKARFEHSIQRNWQTIQRMAKKNVLTTDWIEVVHGASSQMHDIATWKLNKKYTALTKAGMELAVSGKVVLTLDKQVKRIVKDAI